MLPLLENNFGIGFVPEQLALPLIEEGKLVRIPVECSVPKRSVQVISHMGRGKSLAADVFYKVVSETYYNRIFEITQLLACNISFNA